MMWLGGVDGQDATIVMGLASILWTDAYPQL